MVTFLWILTIMLFIAFIVGLAKPAWIMFWSKKPKRWELTGWWILSFFALMLAIGLIEDYSRTPQQLMTDAKVHIIAEDYSTAIDELKRIAPEDAALYAEAQELILQAAALQKEKEKKEAAERAIREEQEKKEQELVAQKETEEQAAREEQRRKDKEQKIQKEAEETAAKKVQASNNSNRASLETENNSWLIGHWISGTDKYGYKMQIDIKDDRTLVMTYGSIRELNKFTIDNADNVITMETNDNYGGNKIYFDKSSQTLNAGTPSEPLYLRKGSTPSTSATSSSSSSASSGGVSSKVREMYNFINGQTFQCSYHQQQHLTLHTTTLIFTFNPRTESEGVVISKIIEKTNSISGDGSSKSDSNTVAYRITSDGKIMLGSAENTYLQKAGSGLVSDQKDQNGSNLYFIKR
jgi:hypothetical protein